MLALNFNGEIRMMFMAKGKHQLVPHDQMFFLSTCSLTPLSPKIIILNCFYQFISLFEELST